MAVLNSVLMFLGVTEAVTPGVAAPGGMWETLILKAFAFVADYGWRIVVFTVLLKLVLSPLDFYQRYKMNKNQKITERLKPTIEKLQRQYGDNNQAFQQKQMELNRKEGYSYMSACLPMIITLIVFFTLWSSMQAIARYMMFKEYTTLYDEYNFVTEQIYTPPEDEGAKLDDDQVNRLKMSKEIGKAVVYQLYYFGLDEDFAVELRKNKDYAAVLPDDFKLLRDGNNVDKVQSSFLWIKNIWAPDVPWGDQAILTREKFESGIGNYRDADKSGLEAADHKRLMEMYQEVMGGLLDDTTQSRTNGYLVLPILVVLLSVGAQLLSMFQQKRAGQVNAKGGMATSLKFMIFLMPLMMAVFAIQSASIFSLYMAVNSATTLFFNVLFTGVIRLMDRIKSNRGKGILVGGSRNSPDIIHYVKGANPNAGARETVGATDKKSKQKGGGTAVVKRGGRPDPNELMNYDMSSDRTKKK